MTSSKVTPRTLKGFQDYPPETMALRLRIIDTIRHHARMAGFNPIDTPALEYSEVLLGVGGETDKQVYRFLDNGERDVALRFDLTVPFARFVAEHLGTLSLPFKRLQMGPVWRAEKPQKGRFREFWQCDLDIIGVNSLAADSEILLCLMAILADLPCGEVTMLVGHREVLTALIRQSLGALNERSLGEALIIIDKLAKIGREHVVTLLAALAGSSRSGAEKLIALLQSDAQHVTPIAPVRTALLGAPSALAELEQLEATLALVNSARGKSGSTVKLNLAIARGLGYYTGLVFETILNANPDWGSICSGGRYNHLIDRFVHQEVPGVGGSIGLDRLVAALMANQENTDQRTDAVFIAVASSDAYGWGFQLAQHLRSEQIPCEIALKEQKLGHQFKYANRHGYPLVITVGGDEVQARTATVKVMDTGHEEKHIPWQQLAARIKEYRNGITNPQRSPGSNP